MLMTTLYTFELEKFVIQNSTKKKITIIALLMIIVGMVLLLSDYKNPTIIAASISCAFPIYHIILFRFMHQIFVKKYDRDPINTTFNWSPNLGPDRAFALSFFFLSVFSSFTLIVPILWGINKS